ncbi:ABC transporter ATP-binding protein [Nitrogeniibacter mangrovi]|uniref:ABC transporter ATP-binding protein n=1 Tax=Nitrogeniibacter mangrovi TaxID=2016596 RepID=A0A6C1B384_9RHOO|nr:ABC transporter ATP-binding protein [Nitrogeniibacter mangrovi]QID16674.1 ABC transporter ATP-binding protein [Nitrogeniibacter mangrovi]
MSAHPTLLEADALAVQIGERWICCDLSMRIAAGERLVLLGPNGAGKTTLLHTLAGLREAQRGSVRLLGRALADWPARELACERGVLPQRQPDWFSATVMETALVGRHPHLGRWAWEGPEDMRIATESLTRMGLEKMPERNILALSGGERQRLAIASLLAQQPALYLLDEPLSHLDLHYQMVVLDHFTRLARAGAGVVAVLHDLNLAARFADHVVLLDGHGHMVSGTADTVLRADVLSAAFGHPIRRHVIDGQVAFLLD